MARKKFPDIAEDFAEREPEFTQEFRGARVPHVQEPQEVHVSHETLAPTYISRAVASEIENLRGDEKEDRNLELGMSQGRKGLKLKRMTMAFSDMNYSFMRTYARQKGITATQLVNDLLSELRKAVYKY